MQKFSSQDRSLLIRFASSLPSGSPEKKVILAGLAKIALDFKVEYSTNRGNGGYVVISAPSKAGAKSKARSQIILNPGEKITSLSVGEGTHYSSAKGSPEQKVILAGRDLREIPGYFDPLQDYPALYRFLRGNWDAAVVEIAEYVSGNGDPFAVARKYGIPTSLNKEFENLANAVEFEVLAKDVEKLYM